MWSPLVRVARLSALVCVLAWGVAPMDEAAAPRPVDAPSDSVVAGAEVRALRKLHLVRPDLIPYPIAYEVCC